MIPVAATDASAVPLADPASQPPLASAAAPASAASDEKPPYALAPDLPTQLGPLGLRFDFNDGCRVLLPELPDREAERDGAAGEAGRASWRVRISDIDTGNILYETQLLTGQVNSAKRYFVRFRLQVWVGDELRLTHDYDAADRAVLVQLPGGTLGDAVGWLPYAVKFQRRHGCRLTLALADYLIPLFRDAYPEIRFVTREAAGQPAADAEAFYATYRIGLFFDDTGFTHQPCDFRHVGLHRTAGYILGVDPEEVPPRLHLPDAGRPIPERYVCIAVQSTTQCKYWNNPTGWREIVGFLKDQGYRVICIDRQPFHGAGLVWTHIPHGAEDQTGDRPITERAQWLRHADFFVGLSSGLSWLAWAAGTPVVMISGFTHPTNEFATPHRVINYHACNSCWNDVRERFDHKDFLWCPRHQGTPRQFECTRLITVDAVKAAIQGVPGFSGAEPLAPARARFGDYRPA